MNDTKVLSKNEKFIKDLYIIGLYIETVNSFQYNGNSMIKHMGVENRDLILISMLEKIYPYIKLKYNYTYVDIDNYIENEYSMLLTPYYFNDMIIKYIKKSDYDYKNDFITLKLLKKTIANIFRVLDSEMKPMCEYISDHINKLLEDDVDTILEVLMDYPEYNQYISEYLSTNWIFYKKVNLLFGNTQYDMNNYRIEFHRYIEEYLTNLSEYDIFYEDPEDDECLYDLDEEISKLLYNIIEDIQNIK